MLFSNDIPLSLYIHIPWCVRKCPYCDFNSHETRGNLPQELYVEQLKKELASYQENRPLQSIFFGGGTPSIFSGESIAAVLKNVATHFKLANDIEITLEANPGTVDQARFAAFRDAGVNRLSIGVQSFRDDKLQALGRIHDSNHASNAIIAAKNAGFDNFNIDLMFGLPQQTIEDALYDLQTAIDLQPTHLSWYQLTLEPNTLFYKNPPVLPQDELIWEMQQQGQALLQTAGFSQYEVSAYSRADKQCRHNLNYWQFGDYVGVGAGAHSKLTDANGVKRFATVKNPRDYLKSPQKSSEILLSKQDLIFEFMLNALRLTDGVGVNLFVERTGLQITDIQPILQTAGERGLLVQSEDILCASELGKKFLNDLMGMFL